MADPKDDDPFKDVIEHPHGGILFPSVLKSKNAKGEIVEKKVRIRVPRPEEMIEAHVRAVVWFQSKKDQSGKPILDRTLDAELFVQMEQLCILAMAIRDWETSAELHDPQELGRYDEASLHGIQEQINIYKLIVDARVDEMTDEQFWAALLQMNRGKTIVPLGAMAGPAQYSFMLRTVSLAASSPEALSYLRASESSTLERSPSES